MRQPGTDEVVEGGHLEPLVRRLLEVVGRLTGLESTYLARIGAPEGMQEVLFARNVGTLEIAEGLRVDWSETLCRRAIEDGRPFTKDVAATWPDSAAAVALGITTFVSIPVTSTGGETYGTMCGASSDGVDVSDDVLLVMGTLAEMVALQLERDAMSAELTDQAEALALANLELERLALTDALTGLGNRRSVERDLSRLCSEAVRRGTPVSAIAIDVDHFKAINDTHGHGAGDEVLVHVADLLRSHARNEDVLGRPGGDELVVLLASADADGAAVIAERLRAAIAEAPIETSVGPVPVTVSVGVATSPGHDPDDLIRAADAALYRAKGAGRDQVGVEDGPVPSRPAGR